jgi:lysylphosphatidylglycerol synthetase-like protein (DUF2156 family)
VYPEGQADGYNAEKACQGKYSIRGLGSREMKNTFKELSPRIAAVLLVLHGLIEITGPVLIGLAPDTLISFGGVTGSTLQQNIGTITAFGVLWGIARLFAGWGAWSLRKWALILGIVLSIVTMVAAVTILPAGITDTVFAVPVLILLLYAWFGNQRIDIYTVNSG